MLSPEEQLQVREVITRVERRVTSELRLRTTPQQAVDFIEVLHSNLDNVVRLANSPDMALECKAGCSHCCNVRVEISEPEALRIARHIAALAPEQTAGLVPCLQRNSALRATSQERSPCAFLRNDLCSIYELRPASCRKAHSLSVAACEVGASEIPQNLLLGLQCETLIAGTNAAYRVNGLPASPSELSAAVLAAVSAPDAADSWFEGKPVLNAPLVVQAIGRSDAV